ncbi:hypothetical protein FDB15_09760 [Clostridium botulinum]|uniref:hypothetical protein n=1 Tax=unclassified Clostridium TaxID=2614128 RepID=UPI0013CA7FF5|nr:MULTISPECIES: hypothetical protein [unclassified Clostridium]NFG31405.1 hypothetical protein [Clostridium botulinum]NFI02587.1 hypothetical protein [Clostridium botulinum]NFI65008.1 hypothetical protein [Clostridium botulinum]NFJ45500.1 hypothetical protein [Clostridium botulinum]NFJ49126.1 hypothetical protein [Clostridium botulinum]
MKIENIQIQSIEYEYELILGYGNVIRAANVRVNYNNVDLRCSIETDEELTNEEIKRKLIFKLE